MLKEFAWRFWQSLSATSYEKEYKEAKKLKIGANLESLLVHASNSVPYYHNLLMHEGGVKNGKVDLGNFSQIPLLTKETIRRETRSLISRDIERRKWFYNTSGGSTGEPIRLIQDRLSAKWADATLKFYYKDILGIEEVCAKKVLLWGARRDMRRKSDFRNNLENKLTNTMFLNSLVMTENDLSSFVRIINSYKPEIIRGYAGPLYELCKFVERKKLSIFSPKIVVSTAETLHSVMRKKIENVFGTKVYDFYGSREVHALAGECRCGLLHLFMFHNYLEVLDQNNQMVNEGEMGKVVVTTLHNFSMPLIRYDLGDTAILGPTKCKCGNPLPTLAKLTGRQIAHFVRENGTFVYGGYFVLLFYGQDWVKAFKVVQEDYKRIRILIALRDKILKENKKREIDEKIKLVMGRDCKITWEIVDQISKTRTGKLIHTQSLLQE